MLFTEKLAESSQNNQEKLSSLKDQIKTSIDVSKAEIQKSLQDGLNVSNKIVEETSNSLKDIVQ